MIRKALTQLKMAAQNPAQVRRVLASELKSYLEDAVPRVALSLDREQTPGIVLADPDQVLVQLP